MISRCNIKEVEFGSTDIIGKTVAEKRTAKVLLLGASDSGKTTVVKQVCNHLFLTRKIFLDFFTLGQWTIARLSVCRQRALHVRKISWIMVKHGAP